MCPHDSMTNTATMNATREHCVRISKKNASGESIGTVTRINTCVVYSISCLVLRCAPTSLLVIIVHAVVSLRLGGVDGPSCAKFDLRASAWVCPWQPAATRNRLRIHPHDSIDAVTVCLAVPSTTFIRRVESRARGEEQWSVTTEEQRQRERAATPPFRPCRMSHLPLRLLLLPASSIACTDR